MQGGFISILLFVAGLMAACSLHAQQPLSGRVLVAGKGFIGATVQLKNTEYGTISGLDGYFTLERVPEGLYTLMVQSVGYRSFSRDIRITKTNQTSLAINLVPDMLNLEEVVVSGTRYAYDRSSAPVIVNVLDNKMLDATQSIAISEGLNYQPGVRVETNCQNCGFTQVRLNGLEGNYSQILINSRAVFSALNSVYGLDQIPAAIVDQIEVVRGGGSALYGSNAIAGTINIITREPYENTWEIRSNTSLIQGDALDQTFNVSGSIVNNNLSSGVTFYGMNRNRDSYDANGDGFTELVLLENNVLGAKAFFKPGDLSKLTVDFSSLTEYRRGGDRLNLAPHFTDITEELAHNTLFGNINYDFWSRNDRNKISLYSSIQHTERDSYYGGLGGGRTPEDSTLALNAYGLTEDVAFVAGTQYNRYLTNNDVFTLGVEMQRYDTRDEIQGYNRLIDQQVNAWGLFGQYEWKPTPRLTTLLGARFDLTDVNGNYEIGQINRTVDTKLGVFSPRVTFMYTLRDNIRFRAGYARGFRAPQAFNEDLHISSVGGEPLFVILSEDLRKETSNAYTASINITKDVGSVQSNLLIEGFYTELENPFTQVSTGAVLSNGSILEEVRNGAGARVSGVNIEAGYSPSDKFALQLGGTVQQTRYQESQVLFEPEGIPTTGESTIAVDEFVRNPNLYGYFTSFYQVTEKLKLDLTGTYTGSMIVPRVVSESGFLNLIDSNPFFDMNIKATYVFKVNEGFQLELSSGIKNVFNSFQDEFDSGPERDSDFVFGPAAPRSIFLSLKIGNF